MLSDGGGEAKLHHHRRKKTENKKKTTIILHLPINFARAARLPEALSPVINGGRSVALQSEGTSVTEGKGQKLGTIRGSQKAGATTPEEAVGRCHSRTLFNM